MSAAPRNKHLDDAALNRLQKRMEGRRHTLLTHLEERLTEDEEARASIGEREVHDTKDVSFIAALAEVRVAGANRDVQELRDLEAALGRMRGGAYGQCSDCGEPIPAARLEAYPTAKRCRLCQEIKEQNDRDRRR